MVWHKAEMQHLHLWMKRRNAQQTIHQCIPQSGTANFGFSGIIIRNNKHAQQGLSICYRQRDMIKPDSFPCCARLLPMPFLVPCHFLSRTGVSIVLPLRLLSGRLFSPYSYSAGFPLALIYKSARSLPPLLLYHTVSSPHRHTSGAAS